MNATFPKAWVSQVTGAPQFLDANLSYDGVHLPYNVDPTPSFWVEFLWMQMVLFPGLYRQRMNAPVCHACGLYWSHSEVLFRTQSADGGLMPSFCYVFFASNRLE